MDHVYLGDICIYCNATIDDPSETCPERTEAAPHPEG